MSVQKKVKVARGTARESRRNAWILNRKIHSDTQELETFQQYEERIKKPKAPMEA